MHVNTIGEQEIWFRYFFNPYYFRTSVKTTFKGTKFNTQLQPWGRDVSEVVTSMSHNLTTSPFQFTKDYIMLNVWYWKCNQSHN